MPADLRVAQIFSTTLRADQSILTGESGSVQKFTDPTESRNAVYQDKTCLMFSVRDAAHAKACVSRCKMVSTVHNVVPGQIRHALHTTTIPQHDVCNARLAC